MLNFVFFSRHYFSILSCDSCVSWHETGRSIMTIVSTTPRPSLTWNSCERTKTSASSRRCVRQYCRLTNYELLRWLVVIFPCRTHYRPSSVNCQTHLEQNQSHVSLTSCELNRRNYSEHVYCNAVFTSLELHFANCSSWTMRPSSLCLQPINTK